MELRQAIKQLRHIDKVSSAADEAGVSRILQNLYETGALPGYTTSEQLMGLDEIRYDWTYVATQEFADLLKTLLILFNEQWPQIKDERADADERMVINIFKIDFNHLFAYESLMALQHQLNKSLDNNSLTIIHVLEQLLIDEQFLCNTWLHFSIAHAQLLSEYASTLHAIPEPKVEKLESLIETFLQLLINIPTHVANKLGKEMPLIFTVNNYSHLLLQHMLRALFALNHMPHIKYSLYIFTKLLQRLLINFGSNDHLSVFLSILQQLALKSNVLRDLLPKLFLSLTDSALPKLILAMLLTDNIDLHVMLKDAIIRSVEWKFCFMHKITIQHAPNNNVALGNIVHYIWKVQPTLLQELFMKLLCIWCKRSALQQLNVMEHFILSKLLLFCARLLFKRIDLLANTLSSIKRELHEGLKHHLQSPDNLQRYVGMQVVEIILNGFQQAACKEVVKDEDLLHFDYKHVQLMQNEHVLQELQQIAAGAFDKKKIKCLEENELMQIVQEFMEIKLTSETTIEKLPEKETNEQNIRTTQKLIAITTKKENINIDLDSDDDDLVACDMVNDTNLVSEKRPKFLMDLIQTLSSKCDNYEVFESAMTNAETLIRQQLAKNDAQMATDLITIFLSLDMQYYVENFEQIKFKCCVAICVAHAEPCASYLCSQFHTENSCYSANSRILMLQILAAASMELAMNNDSADVSHDALNKNNKITAYKRKFNFTDEQTERLIQAQRIVRERLKKKTNRFISKRAIDMPTGNINAFHKVVGIFFFKLIRGPRTQQMLNIKRSHISQDIDTMLLVNFLHTLSVFVINALNCPLIGVIAREVFDLCAFVRFSEESKVRLATLELIGSTLVSTPSHILRTQLNEQLIETQRWLEYFVKSPLLNGEPSEECRDMAAQILHNFYKLKVNITNDL